MLEPFVAPAAHIGVVLVGRAVVGHPLVHVVDVAPGGRDVATGVAAVPCEQGGGDAGASGEQPLQLTEVDDPTG